MLCLPNLKKIILQWNFIHHVSYYCRNTNCSLFSILHSDLFVSKILIVGCLCVTVQRMQSITSSRCLLKGRPIIWNQNCSTLDWTVSSSVCVCMFIPELDNCSRDCYNINYTHTLWTIQWAFDMIIVAIYLKHAWYAQIPESLQICTKAFRKRCCSMLSAGLYWYCYSQYYDSRPGIMAD